MMQASLEQSVRKRRKNFLWLGYLGWIITSGLALLLSALGYSQITLLQLAIVVAAATFAHIVCYLMVSTGIDRRFHFDPHFVFIPNWLFFAPIVAFGYYALGDARGLMQVGWFMGFFFCSGYVRFRGVMLTACWYMALYLVVVLVAKSHGEQVDVLRESIRSGVFLAVCIFFAFLLDMVAAQKEYLKTSLKTLREKDRVISLLNQRLAKFVTTPLVEELAKENSDEILSHQRRRITVFFSDIEGFSIITDAMEPEELANLLNEYFSEMIQIVFRFGGTVDKIMGDGLVVLFGAPVSIEPASGAQRCIQMAINMQERIAVLNEQWKARGCAHEIKVRMGINTGLATVGSFGSDAWANYTAIGSQINIAARLQQIAGPGQILLSQSTHALIANHIQAKKLGKTILKGPHYPIEVYKFEKLLANEKPVAIRWQAQGCSVCLQPEILDISEKESFLQMLERYLGKPTAIS